MRRVIVDTSVFVEFFRGRQVPHFESALKNNAALLSPYVRLELLQGVRKNEARELGYLLGGIPQVPQREELFPLAERMIRRLKGTGLTVGIVDLLIAAQAELFGCLILSFDTRVQEAPETGDGEDLDLAASFYPPCFGVDSTWTCGLARPNGYQALAIWDSSGGPSDFAVPDGYVQYRMLHGSLVPIDPSNPIVSITDMPILLENRGRYSQTLALE